MLYMLTAGKKALVDGGLTEGQMEEIDKSRCGVLIGSGIGGMKVYYILISNCFNHVRNWNRKGCRQVLLVSLIMVV